MEAMVQHNLLLWAIERAQATIDVLSKKLKVNEKKIASWIAGEDRPTFKQAQKLAKALQIPFGYLFLSEIPKEELPLPDLSTIRDEPTYHTSAVFKELLYDLDRKQRWYREYIIENGAEPLEFIGKFSIYSRKQDIILDIREKLEWQDAFNSSTKDEYISQITKMAEKLGILVMRSSYMGASTQKSLLVTEFRGLAISDSYAPLIFINTADAKSAQIFTLAHELVHLWIGESGISDLQMFINFNNQIEKFCNEIAAELLLPENDFRDFWNANESIEENCKRVSKIYHVSFVMVAKRAYDVRFISYDEYVNFYQQQMKEWTKIKKNKKTGGNYYSTAPIRTSKLFSHSVISSTLEGKLLYRDATKLLNIKKMATFNKFIQEMGVR